MLLGDINLLGVDDPRKPFAKVAERLDNADVVFANLECCLYDKPAGRSAKHEGFYAGRHAGAALRAASIDVVGTANNVTFGPSAIEASLVELDRLGILHTGSGRGEAAHAPAVLTRDGLRLGFMQRTSIYWPTEHEAVDEETGVAVMRGHTAYSPILEFNGLATRPGVPARVITWADPDYLAKFRAEVADLRKQADYVVCSHHWGYREDVLEYQQQYAHAAIEAGADLVFGHGPHHPQPIEIYRGKPIFYCVGSFFFESGHRGRIHGNWVGLTVSVDLVDGQAQRVAFRFVRRSDGATYWRASADEVAELERLRDRSKSDYGTDLHIDGDEVVVWRRADHA
jgi:poly-gamma-glutamate synthesis protein (capsule biosynthesis protein)